MNGQHVLRRRFMGRAPFWRCDCGFETADLAKVAQHAVNNQYEVRDR